MIQRDAIALTPAALHGIPLPEPDEGGTTYRLRGSALSALARG